MLHKPSQHPHWSAWDLCWLDQSLWCGCPSQSFPRWCWTGTDPPWWGCRSCTDWRRWEKTFLAETAESHSLRFTPERLFRPRDAPSCVPVDSCWRRPGKNGGLTASLHTLRHPHTHREWAYTQSDTHIERRHALKENPGLCHISHRVVGRTGKGLHIGTNFHHRVRQQAQLHPPSPVVAGELLFHSKSKLILERIFMWTIKPSSVALLHCNSWQ